MRRRKKQEEHVNHERWLISYADFITLLFAFFVVMYSISSVNEGKYRVLSDTLSEAFEEEGDKSNPIQIGEISPPIESEGNQIESIFEEENIPNLIDLPFDMADPDEGELDESEGESEGGGELEAEADTDDQEPEKEMIDFSEKVDRALASFVNKGDVSIRKNKLWTEIEMKSSLLFSSGQARLSRKSIAPLKEVAEVLKPLNNMIYVEGYTDNVGIKNLTFPSNWELSAARAASVVNLFTRLGVQANRLAAVGYGEHRPIADNATKAGRNKNRRVTIFVMANTKEKNAVRFYQQSSSMGSRVAK
jgi:chemotaxis protein MotB